jgi:hypothetical protein
MELQSENADIGIELESEQKRSKFCPIIKKISLGIDRLARKAKNGQKDLQNRIIV